MRLHIIFPIFILFFSVHLLQAQTRTLVFVNNMSKDIWVGTQGAPNAAVPANGGFVLPARGEYTLQLPNGSSSLRFWGRTGCNPQTGKCETGDCTSGKVECNGMGGVPPITLVEMTLGDPKAQNADFYDISLVDGYNLPIRIIPVVGTFTPPTSGNPFDCGIAGCTSDLNKTCPLELQVNNKNGDTIACKSGCMRFNTDRFCCRNAFGTPDKCPPTDYSMLFKEACPDAYSYAYDDLSSTYVCFNATYRIEFGILESTGKPTAKIIASKVTGTAPLTVNFDASGSFDPNGKPLTYFWDFHDNSNGTGKNIQHTYTQTGSHIASLTVNNGVSSDVAFVKINVGATNLLPSINWNLPLDGSVYSQGSSITFSVTAEDESGISLVEFFADGLKIGDDSTFPYSFVWLSPTNGKHILTARATDNLNHSASTAEITVNIGQSEGGGCTLNDLTGDFKTIVSGALSNPTITFIPLRTGVGETTCILYYSLTGVSPFGGHLATQGLPFQINASLGNTVYFYYTYSVPEGGERNNSANKFQVKIGDCTSTGINSNKNKDITIDVKQTDNSLFLDFKQNQINLLEIYNLVGQKIISSDHIVNSFLNIDISILISGFYYIKFYGSTNPAIPFYKK